MTAHDICVHVFMEALDDGCSSLLTDNCFAWDVWLKLVVALVLLCCNCQSGIESNTWHLFLRLSWTKKTAVVWYAWCSGIVVYLEGGFDGPWSPSLFNTSITIFRTY